MNTVYDQLIHEDIQKGMQQAQREMVARLRQLGVADDVIQAAKREGTHPA